MKCIVSLMMRDLTLNDVVESLPPESIPDYYANKNVFITGATGFLGKVLIEKLLRTCSNIRKIYCLIRPGSKHTFNEKFNRLLNSKIFDLIRNKNKDILNKIVVIEGDISQLKLGISIKNWNKLVRKVHIIYHLAATINFKKELGEAILVNVRGTREVCKLALQARKLIALVHFSTIYCYPNENKIYETYYDPPMGWREAIEIAENIDEALLLTISSKFCGCYANVHTFTKALSESVLKDLCDGKVSTIVLRPSIVLSTYREPIKGWVENLNGPTGIIFGISMGIIRINLMAEDGVIDMIPADIVVSAVIKATWVQSFIRHHCSILYNITNYKKPIKTEILWQIIKETVLNVSLKSIWYPTVSLTNNYMVYEFNFYLFQMLPSLIMDFVLFISAKEPRMLKLQKLIYDNMKNLNYCSSKNWNFDNTNFTSLNNYLLECDKSLFTDEDYDLANIEYNVNSTINVSKCLQLNYIQDFEDNAERLNRLKFLDKSIKFIGSLICIFIAIRFIHLYFQQHILKTEEFEVPQIKFS